MTPQQLQAVQKVSLAILETIEEAGELGAPAGVMYAGLMTQGCTLDQFQQLTQPLVRRGFITHEDDLFVMTDAGRVFTKKLKATLG